MECSEWDVSRITFKQMTAVSDPRTLQLGIRLTY